MNETSETKMILLVETLADRIARDVVTFTSLSGMIGVGWLLDSSAMQWIGGILWMLWFIGRLKNIADRNRKTPQEAADYIAERFGVRAKP